MLLENKVVLVTGSTMGIGAAIARRCVEEGAKVMIHGLDEEARAKKLCQELGDAVQYCLADLAYVDSCETIVSETVSTYGKVDA